MLSRHAENLFWIGRYIERSEDTARLLDVTYHGVLESGSERSPAQMWKELLEILVLDDSVKVDAAAVGEVLLGDPEHRASIPNLIARARENARTTREWISSEVWESINDLHLSLREHDLVAAAREQPYEMLRMVKSACQAISGSVEATMPRGEGYDFFLLGGRLERASITARVLNVWKDRPGIEPPQAAFVDWAKILKSVSAYESYLRAHRATMDGDKVLAFLLQAPNFPRSVLNCLAHVSELLQHVETGEIGDSARRSVGMVRSRVEFTDLGSVDHADFLDEVESSVAALASEVEGAYFRPSGSTFMHSYEAF